MPYLPLYGTDREARDDVSLEEWISECNGHYNQHYQGHTQGIRRQVADDVGGFRSDHGAIFHKEVYLGLHLHQEILQRDVLGVSQNTLDDFGAVSPQTAAELAQDVCRCTGSDIGLSFTGVAGPDPDEGKEVGLVYIGLARGEQVWVKEVHLGTARDRVRNSAVLHGFDMVRRLLTGLNVV